MIRIAFDSNPSRAWGPSRGVTLVELIIAMLLFVTVTSAAYRIYIVATRNAQETRQESIENRKTQQFFERFRHQIENAVQLPNSAHSYLEIEVPAACEVPPNSSIFGWGLVSFPGHDRALMDENFSSLYPINPQDYAYLVNDDSSDAVTMVYVLPDTVMHKLHTDSTTGVVSHQTGGSDDIHIEHTANLDLQVGDFAVISDTLRTELIRITDIEDVSTHIVLEHDDAKSVWNFEFDPGLHFGLGNNNSGGAFLYKVGVATYALDTETNTLMLDDHRLDDGFDGQSFGTPGLARNWQPAISGITKLQIIYTTIYGETRAPMAGMPGISFEICDGAIHIEPDQCECENQLGNKGLENIRLEITYE